MATIKKVHILGDQQLVSEYSKICSGKGLSITDAASSDAVLELTNLSVSTKKANLLDLEKKLPPDVFILSSSITITVAEQASWMQFPSRLAGIGALPTLLEGALIEFSACTQTDDNARSKAESFALALGKSSVFVQDSVGLVMPRILCMLINEACFAMMEGVAEGTDIDTAMKLGTNYPKGPVEWAEQIGVQQVHAVMRALYQHFGEDRYRVSPLLQKAALSGSF